MSEVSESGSTISLEYLLTELTRVRVLALVQIGRHARGRPHRVHVEEVYEEVVTQLTGRVGEHT